MSFTECSECFRAQRKDGFAIVIEEFGMFPGRGVYCSYECFHAYCKRVIQKDGLPYGKEKERRLKGFIHPE